MENKISLDKKQYDLNFRVEKYKENIVAYIFKNVVVVIDTTGKNYKALPEILFSTYDNEINKDDFMHQPQNKIIGADMEYVAKCIKEVSAESDINTFWFHPFGNDMPEKKENREEARLRLFSRFGNIIQDPSGFGYILKIK